MRKIGAKQRPAVVVSRADYQRQRPDVILLAVTSDALVFDADERGPDDDLRLQFEALSQFSVEEKKIARVVIDGLILKHTTQRSATAAEAR